MKFLNSSLTVLLGAGVVMWGAQGPLHADDFPSGPVTLVVGFSAGGETDAGARGFATFWEETLGTPVIIDNRPGAGMQIALEHAWEHGNDGHVLLWHNQQYISSIELEDPDVPYRSDQWVWLDILESDPANVTVRHDAPWANLDELIEDIRARPGEVTVGMLSGSIQLLACKVLFEKILDVQIREVPQTSGAPMRASLAGGHLDAICTNDAGTHAMGDEGRALAVFADRSALHPDSEPINEFLERNGHTERLPAIGSLRGPTVPRPFVENHPERYQALVDSYQEAIQLDSFRQYLADANREAITQHVSTEEAERIIEEYNQFFHDHQDIFLGN